MFRQQNKVIPGMSLTNRLVSTNLGMVLDIPLGVLLPNDRVIILFTEESRNITCPCFDGLKILVTEDTGQVSMDGQNGSTGKVVTEDSKRRDRLWIPSVSMNHN